MNKEKIFRIARIHRLKMILLFVVFAILFGFGVYSSVVKTSEFDMLTVVLAVLMFIGSIVGVVWNLIFLVTPLREKIFRRSGSVEKALELVNSHESANITYTDRYVTISPFAISFNKQPLHIIDVYDILAVFKERKSIDSFLESDCLIIVDAWGEQHAVQYRRRKQKDVDAAIDALREVCDPELTKFGRTVESIDWIAQNQLILPRYDSKTKSIERGELETVEQEADKPKTKASKASTKNTTTQKTPSKTKQKK